MYTPDDSFTLARVMNLERFKFEFYQSKKKILMPRKLVPEGTKHSVVYEAKFVDIYFFFLDAPCIIMLV